MAERWYGRLSHLFGHELSSKQSVILYASHPDFEQTNVVEGELDEGTGGVTESARRRVVLPMAATARRFGSRARTQPYAWFRTDILGRNAEGLPLWFIEGMAEYLRWTGRLTDRDVAARFGDSGSAAEADRPRQPALLPVPLRPRPVGLRRRQAWRQYDWSRSCRPSRATAGPAARPPATPSTSSSRHSARNATPSQPSGAPRFSTRTASRLRP